MNEENSKLQNAFIYIILVLLFLSYAGFIFVACRCYAPYSFWGSLSVDGKVALWSLMILPAAILPIALWLANILNRKLGSFTLLTVLLSCCFIVAVPRIYSFANPVEMSYFTSVFSVFLIACSSCAVIRDLKKTSKKQNAFISFLSAVLLMILFSFLLYIVAELVFIRKWLYGIGLCYVVPITALLVIFESLLDVYAGGTIFLKLASVGYGCLCAGFIELCDEKLWVSLYVLISLLALIWQVIDLVKFFIVRRKKNDSESCNA